MYFLSKPTIVIRGVLVATVEVVCLGEVWLSFFLKVSASDLELRMMAVSLDFLRVNVLIMPILFLTQFSSSTNETNKSMKLINQCFSSFYKVKYLKQLKLYSAQFVND